MFDAIVCDPPYGIREGSRQLADVQSQSPAAAAPSEDVDVVSSAPVRVKRLAVVDALQGLLDFAAQVLVPGGEQL